MSPNLEFATIFVGVLAVLFFGLTFWQAVARHRARHGARLVLPRRALRGGPSSACRRWCSAAVRSASAATSCPAGLNAIIAGIGWFAVNSVQRRPRARPADQLPKAPVPGHRRVQMRRSPSSGTTSIQPLRAVRVPGAGSSSSIGAVMILTKSTQAGTGGHAGPGRVLHLVRRHVRLRRRLEPLRHRLHPLPAAAPRRRRPACGPGSASSSSCVALRDRRRGRGDRRRRRD